MSGGASPSAVIDQMVDQDRYGEQEIRTLTSPGLRPGRCLEDEADGAAWRTGRPREGIVDETITGDHFRRRFSGRRNRETGNGSRPTKAGELGIASPPDSARTELTSGGDLGCRAGAQIQIKETRRRRLSRAGRVDQGGGRALASVARRRCRATRPALVQGSFGSLRMPTIKCRHRWQLRSQARILQISLHPPNTGEQAGRR